MSYDWRKTLFSAVKAGAYVAIGLIVADPNITPALTAMLPNEWRPVAALLVPTLIAAIKNWLQNKGK